MRNFCQSVLSLGWVNAYSSREREILIFYRRPVSFHSVSFGVFNGKLRNMAQIAREVENTAPRDKANSLPSSYTEAMSTVSTEDHSPPHLFV